MNLERGTPMHAHRTSWGGGGQDGERPMHSKTTRDPKRGTRVGEARRPGPHPEGHMNLRLRRVPGDGQCLFHAFAAAGGQPECEIRARLRAAASAGAVGRYFHEAGIPAGERSSAIQEHLNALDGNTRGDEIHMHVFAAEYAVTLWVRQDPQGDYMEVGNGTTAVHIRWMGSAWDSPDAHFDALERTEGPGPSRESESSPTTPSDLERPRGDHDDEERTNRVEPSADGAQHLGSDAQTDSTDIAHTEPDIYSESGEGPSKPHRWRLDRDTWPGKVGHPLRTLSVCVCGVGGGGEAIHWAATQDVDILLIQEHRLLTAQAATWKARLRGWGWGSVWGAAARATKRRNQRRCRHRSQGNAAGRTQR